MIEAAKLAPTGKGFKALEEQRFVFIAEKNIRSLNRIAHRCFSALVQPAHLWNKPTFGT
jgi:hypothetical protein